MWAVLTDFFSKIFAVVFKEIWKAHKKPKESHFMGGSKDLKKMKVYSNKQCFYSVAAAIILAMASDFP